MASEGNPAPCAVLVVEDDPFLLADALDLADDAGLTAFGARNAGQAVALLERHGGEIGILFTDIEMPGAIDGLMLARDVNRRWPPVAIMLTSGVVSVDLSDLPNDCLFFSKPYAPREIVNAMQAIAVRRRG